MSNCTQIIMMQNKIKNCKNSYVGVISSGNSYARSNQTFKLMHIASQVKIVNVIPSKLQRNIHVNLIAVLPSKFPISKREKVKNQLKCFKECFSFNGKIQVKQKKPIIVENIQSNTLDFIIQLQGCYYSFGPVISMLAFDLNIIFNPITLQKIFISQRVRIYRQPLKQNLITRFSTMSKQQFISSSFNYKQQNPDYQGQKLDPQYARGPAQERPCTDLICLILFIVFIGAMGYVAYLALQSGDPSLLASPFDQAGNQCKYAPGYEQYQKIYVSVYLKEKQEYLANKFKNSLSSSFSSEKLSLQQTERNQYKTRKPKSHKNVLGIQQNNDLLNVTFVCVKQCPTNQTTNLECKTNSKISSCNILELYPTKAIVNLCLPINAVDLDNFSDYLDLSVLQQYFSDLQEIWPAILGVMGFCLLYCLIFCILMRYCAGVFIWSFIVFFILFQFIIGTLSFLLPFVPSLQELIHYDQLPENLRNRDYQIGVGILCWTLGLITFLIVCCMKKQIRISIGIIKAAADFSRQQVITLLFPIYATLLQVICLAVWVTIMLFLFSSSSKIEPVAGTPFGFVQFDQNLQYLTLFYVFGIIWIIFFISGLSSFWVCSAVAIWYFEQGHPSWPICKSIGRSFKSMGSIAFGSLIIAIVFFIKIMLQILNQQLKQKTLNANIDGGVAKFAIKCASCCIACFQRVVRFLTQNAYIMMAITGKNFCSSAKQAFYLMVRSTAQYAVSHGTTKVFIFIAKSLVVSVSALSGYLLITQIEYFKTRVYEPFFITVIFVIVSFPIAMAFMQFFQMAANTLLMCYCLEQDVLKGNNPRCPEALRRFLQQYVKSASELQSSYA